MEATARENRSQTIFMQVLLAIVIVLSAVEDFRHIIGYVTFGIISLIIIWHKKRKKGSNDPKIPGYMIAGYFSIRLLFIISTRLTTKDLGPFSLMNIALDEIVVLSIGWIVWMVVRKKMAEHALKDVGPDQG